MFIFLLPFLDAMEVQQENLISNDDFAQTVGTNSGTGTHFRPASLERTVTNGCQCSEIASFKSEIMVLRFCFTLSLFKFTHLFYNRYLFIISVLIYLFLNLFIYIYLFIYLFILIYYLFIYLFIFLFIIIIVIISKVIHNHFLICLFDFLLKMCEGRIGKS